MNTMMEDDNQHSAGESAGVSIITQQAPPALPPTSLIICSRNRPQLLADTIDSILSGDQLPNEIVIIDQSSAPHPSLPTLTCDRDCDIRYLWTRSVGLSRANNTGIAAARYDLLVFTHDDVLATPNWFGAIVTALLEAGARSVVSGQVRPTTPQTPGGFVPSTKVATTPAIYRGRIGSDVLYPMNMAMYRSVFSEVGDFDERLGPGTPFPGAEDNDLGFRLLEAGYRIVYAPQAAVDHRAWRTAQEYVSLQWNYARAQGAYYAKHFSPRDPYMLRRMVRDLAVYIRRLPGRVRFGRRIIYGDLAWMGGLLSGALQWTLMRRIADRKESKQVG